MELHNVPQAAWEQPTKSAVRADVVSVYPKRVGSDSSSETQEEVWALSSPQGLVVASVVHLTTQ